MIDTDEDYSGANTFLEEPYIPYLGGNKMPGLSAVTVKKEELLKKLKKNRKAHRKLFEEAVEGYRKQVIKELDTMLDDAKNGKKIRRTISLPEPEDHTEDYDRVIEMIDMSIGPDIELTHQEFTQYVRDDWGWKAHFEAVSSTYVN